MCERCGACCCKRTLQPTGEVIVDFSSTCEFLDNETRLCRVFEKRFSTYSYCGKLTIFRALFDPYLPPCCAYVKTFRSNV